MAVAGVIALTDLVTPSVLITAGAIVLNAFTERYDKLGDRVKAGEGGFYPLHLRELRRSILAVLSGLCLLALSVIALTLAEVLVSTPLAYLAVALVLAGSCALVFGIAYATVVLLRRPADLAKGRWSRQCRSPQGQKRKRAGALKPRLSPVLIPARWL